MGWTIAAAGIIAAISAGVGVHQGEQSARAGRRNLRQQQRAQSDAQTAALRQRRESEQAFNKANRRKPDITSILAAAQEGGSGIGGNPLGVNPLGGSSSLGL